MDNLIADLENLLLTQSLSEAEHDSVEHALDEGYLALSDKEKALLRRLLNRKAAEAHLSPLQRYRAHRQDIARATIHQLRTRSARRPAAATG